MHTLARSITYTTLECPLEFQGEAGYLKLSPMIDINNRTINNARRALVYKFAPLNYKIVSRNMLFRAGGGAMINGPRTQKDSRSLLSRRDRR